MSSSISDPAFTQVRLNFGPGPFLQYPPAVVGGPVAGWAPSDYGTPTLWVDMSMETGFSDGDFIDAVTDRAGSNTIANAVSDATRANYDEDAFGTGKAGAVFDNTTADLLDITTPVPISGEFTIIAVIKPNGSTDSMIGGHGTNNVQVRRFRSGANNLSIYLNGTPEVVGPTMITPAAGVAHLAIYRRSAGNISFVVNKDARGGGTANTRNTDFNRIGNVPAAGGGDYTLAELVIFSDLVSAADLRTIWFILRDKWKLPGVTLFDDMSDYSVESPITVALGGGEGLLLPDITLADNTLITTGVTDAPSNYSNLEAHFDAIQLSGFADQDPIATGADDWPDETVNAHDLSQATGSLQPLYTINQLVLGDKAVTFDGGNDYLDMASDIALSGDFTIIVVGTVLADSLHVAGRATNAQFRRFRSAANNMSIYDQSAEHVSVTTGMPANDATHMMTYRRSGTALSYRGNKTAVASSSGGTTSATITVGRVGKNNGAFAEYNGAIGEICIYTGHLSDAEVDALFDDYFQPRWGIQV